MEQARKRQSPHNKNPHEWPTAVHAAMPFGPADDQPQKIVVYCLDYAIFTVLQITCIAQTPLTVMDLVVNGEFRPAFVIGSLSEQFSRLRLPTQMGHGSSFGAVLRAPAAANVPLDCCYPKVPASLVVSTDHGDFTFIAGEIIRPTGKLCAGL